MYGHEVLFLNLSGIISVTLSLKISELSSSSILQPLNVNKELYTYTDISYFGTAFAAFQPTDQNPNQHHVVGYGG
jgi:hypothetical protein